ncbi:MAG: DUF3267 domain-containing protein [Bacteroidota bacterium]
MKIKPEELLDNGYFLIDNLDHHELIPFVRKYLKKRTPFSIFYTLSNLVIASIIVFWFWKNYGTYNFHLDEGFTHFSYGIGLAFSLIPIHEYIHVLAYKSQGAENTSYDANWKKFYFMAIADRFVANKKEFQIVALAPFVVISATLILLLFFSNLLWSFTILGVLLTHTAFTSGDFGLLSYFDFHKEKEILTYDDKENGISYFYGKEK